jgi:hypothetical protein
VSREFTGAGFYTLYSLNNCDDLRIDSKTFQIGDVSADVGSIKWAIGFVLFIEKGCISMLEGYTVIADRWPTPEEEIILFYDSGEANLSCWPL